jgi:uncharacterized protein (DUF427 family)
MDARDGERVVGRPAASAGDDERRLCAAEGDDLAALHPRESVWDYPRPPRLEASARHVLVIFAGETIVDSRRPLRVLETSHPPVYYVPFEDVVVGTLLPTGKHTWCEFKGQATYFDVVSGNAVARDAAWHYPSPAPGYDRLSDHVAFYPSRMQACCVDGERVRAQEGDFYGGWITSEIEGPFKGGAGTRSW